MILKKLSAYPRQNGLAKALREIGRIERTLFTLDWIKNPDLRRRAHLGLNKGEARNALAVPSTSAGSARWRDRTFENQFFRASGLPARRRHHPLEHEKPGGGVSSSR